VAVLREAPARDDFERLKKVPATIFTLVRKLKATAAAIAGRHA